MANFDKKTPVSIYVVWIMLAIIGTAVLFTGIQLAVNAQVGIVVSVMLIVLGALITFLGLTMTLGYANIEAKADAEEKASKKAAK